MQRKSILFDAKIATINFEMQRIKFIFVAKNTTNGNIHTSAKKLDQF